MTYQDICRRIAVSTDAREAKAITRILLEELFGMSYADMLCGGVETLSDEDTHRLDAAVDRIAHSEPLQYVLGYADFAGLRFGVAPGVLIPRPETEWLVEEAEHASASTAPRILDIGTGSGCIAVSLKLRLPEAYVEAWDVSKDALAIARANAETLSADIVLRERDALATEKNTSDDATEEPWDVIVSNPPYICLGERRDMDDNVLRHEPSTALFVPDGDPLLFYRAIASYAMARLREGGRLLFECNTRYVRDTADMMRDMGMRDVREEDDCFGMPRFAEGRRP